jgi:hypothetical protein
MPNPNFNKLPVEELTPQQVDELEFKVVVMDQAERVRGFRRLSAHTLELLGLSPIPNDQLPLPETYPDQMTLESANE